MGFTRAGTTAIMLKLEKENSVWRWPDRLTPAAWPKDVDVQEFLEISLGISSRLPLGRCVGMWFIDKVSTVLFVFGVLVVDGPDSSGPSGMGFFQ
jgi:hypothetical protein